VPEALGRRRRGRLLVLVATLALGLVFFGGGDAGPSEPLQDPVRHSYPRHLSLSTDLAVRNRPKAMKLR